MSMLGLRVSGRGSELVHTISTLEDDLKAAQTIKTDSSESIISTISFDRHHMNNATRLHYQQRIILKMASRSMTEDRMRQTLPINFQKGHSKTKSVPMVPISSERKDILASFE